MPKKQRSLNPRVIRDSVDLRNFLIDKMQKVATGKIKVDQCKAISNLAQQVYNTKNLEIKLALAQKTLGGERVKPVSFDGDGNA